MPSKTFSQCPPPLLLKETTVEMFEVSLKQKVFASKSLFCSTSFSQLVSSFVWKLVFPDERRDYTLYYVSFSVYIVIEHNILWVLENQSKR